MGAGNVAVSGGTLPQDTLSITFQGAYAGDADSRPRGRCHALRAEPPRASTWRRQRSDRSPTRAMITSVPNTIAAIDGNNAQVRVIMDGSQTGGSTGLVLDASQSIIRGLAIEGFGIGISIPEPTDVGDLIQGNFIGPYLAYPVDQSTGDRSAAARYGHSGRRGQHAGRDLAGLGQRDGGRVQSGREQRDLRQRRARRLARCRERPATRCWATRSASSGRRRTGFISSSATAPTGCGSSHRVQRAIRRASSIRRAT